VLGYKVVYAPGAVVRHIGGATGSRSGAHRRYTLWECNSLATILKNYESGHMEQIFTAALILLYKRALLAACDAFDPLEYLLTGPADANAANIERIPKISVAHLAAIDRLNSLLPRFMEERARIQSRRVRSDAEILPLLGRAYEPQFAGSEYAAAARQLACSLDLYDITRQGAPNRVLVLAPQEEADSAQDLAASFVGEALVALALLSDTAFGQVELASGGFAVHSRKPNDPALLGLIEQADAIVTFPSLAQLPALTSTTATRITTGPQIGPEEAHRLLQFCREPHL